MAVKTYSVKKLGRTYLVSPHFKLSEFQCRNGADLVKIDSELLKFLEALRDYLGGDGHCTIAINSGYRTESYNRSIGGASNSTHCKGYAADVIVKQNGKRVSGKLICCLAQTLKFKGIAYIKGSGYAVHLDMYPRTYRGDERYGYENNVGGDFYSYFGIKKSQIDALKITKSTTIKIEEEEEMTQQQFNEMMEVYLKTKAQKPASEWSKDARQWAEKSVNGQVIVAGTGNGQEYDSWVTREQVVTMLHRCAKRGDIV